MSCSSFSLLPFVSSTSSSGHLSFEECEFFLSRSNRSLTCERTLTLDLLVPPLNTPLRSQIIFDDADTRTISYSSTWVGYEGQGELEFLSLLSPLSPALCWPLPLL